MSRLIALEPKRRFNQALSGAWQPSGVLATQTGTGDAQEVPKNVSGALGLSGTVTGVVGGESIVTVPKGVSGQIAPAGSVDNVIDTGTPLPIATVASSGQIAPVGTVVGVVGGESLVTVLKSLGGALFVTGSLPGRDVIQSPTQNVVGTIQPTGSVAGVKSGPDLITLTKSLAGTITPASSLARAVDNTLVPDFTQAVDGTITPAGAVTGVQGGQSLVTILKSIAGTLSPSGAFSQVSAGNRVKSIAGSITPSGAVVGVKGGPSLVTIPKAIGGSLAPTSVLARLVIAPPPTFFSQELTATLTPHGSLATSAGGPSLVTIPKSVGGNLVLVGSVARVVGGRSLVTILKSIGGAWQPVGVVTKSVSGPAKITKSVTGTITPHGTVTKVVGGGVVDTRFALLTSIASLDMSELDDPPGWPAITFTQTPTTVNNVKTMLDAMRVRGIKGGVGLISPNSYGDVRADGTWDFNFNSYKALANTIAAVPNIASYIADGTLDTVCCGDELQHPKWNNTIPPSTRKAMCDYVKSVLPGVKTSLRMPYQNLSGNELPPGGWGTSLDYGWAQYTGPNLSASSGMTAPQFFVYQRDHLALLGVGIITGGNWWNGGDGSSGITGQDPTKQWAMSPQEIRACIDAAVDIVEAHYHMWWTDAHNSNLGDAAKFYTLQQRADYAAAFKYSKDVGLARGGNGIPPDPITSTFYTNTGFFTAPAPPTLNVGAALRDSLTGHKVFKLVANGRLQDGTYSPLNADNSVLYYIVAGVGTLADVTWNLPVSTVQVGNVRNAFGSGGVAGLTDGVIWNRTARSVFFFVGAASAKVYKRDITAQTSTLLKDFALDNTYSTFWSARGVSATRIFALHGDRDQDHLAALVVNNSNSATVGAVAWDRSDGRIWLYASPSGKVATRVTLDDSGQYMKVVFSDKTWENVELISNNFTQQLGVLSDSISPPTDDDSDIRKMYQANGRGVFSRDFEPPQQGGDVLYAHPQRLAKIDVYSQAKVSMLSAADAAVYYTMYYGGPTNWPWVQYSGSIYKVNWAAVMAGDSNKRVPDIVRQGNVQLTKVG